MNLRQGFKLLTFGPGIFLLAWFGTPGQALSMRTQEGHRKPERDNVRSESAVLLRRAYEITKGRPASERAFVLTALADTSLRIDQELAATYAKELFDSSWQVPPHWYNYRNAFQMNAVIILARAGRLGDATELFDRMEPPEAIAESYQDPREGALLALIPLKLKVNRAEGLAWAARAVGHVGATGRYPYLAAKILVEELLGADPSEAERMYTQAVTQFKQEKAFASARRSFVRFVLPLAGKIHPDLERGAVLAATDALVEAKAPQNQRTVVRLTLEGGDTLTLNSGDDRLLFDLMPLLRKYAPDQAEKIASLKGDLGKASKEGARIKDEQSVVIIGERGETRKLDAIATKRIDWQQVGKVREIGAGDPTRAQTIAEKIGKRGPRAAALAEAAAALARSDPQRARQLLQESRSLWEGIEEPSERLRVWLSVLRASVKLEDGTQTADRYGAILELGSELLEREMTSAPDFPLFVTTSFQQLSEATEVAAGLDPEARLAQISSVQNPVLQAHLLVVLARAGTESSKP